MSSAIALTHPTVRTQVLGGVVALAASVLLPQLAHLVGAAAGVGNTVGVVWLPMHLPVIAVGLLLGWRVGLVTGLLAPAVSLALTGMPAMPMVGFMTAELATYGAVAGLVATRERAKGTLRLLGHTLVSLIAVQVAGRLVSALAIWVGTWFGTTVAPASVLVATQKALPGLILQWIALPLLVLLVAGADD